MKWVEEEDSPLLRIPRGEEVGEWSEELSLRNFLSSGAAAKSGKEVPQARRAIS